jgi:hypothetical protein
MIPSSFSIGPSGEITSLTDPSLYRIVRTTFDGWRRYHNHPDVRIRERFDRELAKLKSSYTGVLWAMERQLKMANVSIALKVRELRKEIQNEVGTGAWLSTPVENSPFRRQKIPQPRLSGG